MPPVPLLLLLPLLPGLSSLALVHGPLAALRGTGRELSGPSSPASSSELGGLARFSRLRSNAYHRELLANRCAANRMQLHELRKLSPYLDSGLGLRKILPKLRFKASLGPSELEDIEMRFKLADMDGDGRLDQKELRNVLECTESFCLNRHWLPVEQVESILRQYDAGGKGFIDLQDFYHLAGDKQLLEGKLEEYLEAFQGMDQDDNGSIDLEEMKQYMKTLDSSDAEIEALFSEGDMNNDSKIDFAEFLGLVRSQAVDIDGVLKYLEMNTGPSATATEVMTMPVPGEVNMIHGKEEMDYLLKNLKKPIILMIAFHWCRPCKGFSKKYERFADGFKDLTFLKVYGEESQSTKALVKHLAVKSSPAFYLFSGEGELVSNFKGANEDTFRTKILEFINGEAVSAEV